MTDVQKTNTRKITTPEDALGLYAPPPAAYTGKMGIEVEIPLIETRTGAPDVMQKIQSALQAKGYDAQLEPAGVLEYASPAATPAEIAKLVSRIKNDLDVFTSAAAAEGLTRVPFSIVPTTTEEEALSRTVSRPRLQVSIGAMKEIFPPDTLRLPLLTAAVQTSFSPKDADEMFDMATRA
jgi:gamma-glutamylcysteine synthetase